MLESLRKNWGKYLIEAAALGCFMISACIIVVLMEYPGSPLHAALPNATIRLYIIGAELGVTAYLLVASPWGKRSGPHMNPAFTLSFLLLGEIGFWDAIFYMIFQFAGGYAGVQLSYAVMGAPVSHPSVGFVVTAPGPKGNLIAFLAELGMSVLLMTCVLAFGQSKRLQSWTPHMVGALIGLYCAFEAPLSGMSINPARTFASALSAHQWTALWIYFAAPVLGMVGASQIFTRLQKRHAAKKNGLAANATPARVTPG